MNFEFGDLMKSPVRPPAPEIPRAEQLERERQMIFHSYQSGGVPHEDPPHSGPVDPSDICVLNERGAHLRLGRRCPHGLIGADFETVTQVDF